jgi:hypothetical protein
MIKTGFSNIPQSIIDFEKKSDLKGLSNKWKQGKISQEDLSKPYVSNAYWESGSNVCFCDKNEAIEVILDSKSRGYEDSFDVEIYNFKTGELINYSVDYVVNLEE